MLGYLLPLGIPVLSGALIGAIDNFIVLNKWTPSRPYLEVIKTFTKATNGSTQVSLGDTTTHNKKLDSTGEDPRSYVDLELTIKNIGTIAAWGVPIRVLDGYGFSNQPPVHMITRALNELGFNTESMFSREYPRYFPVDLFGTGMFTGLGPTYLDIKAMILYSQNFSQTIYENRHLLANRTGLSIEEILNFASKYNRTQNLYNPANWRILPNESLTIHFAQYLQPTPSSVSNYSSELLYPSTVRYSDHTGIQHFESISNSIMIQKRHQQHIMDGVSFYHVDITHATSVLQVGLISNHSDSGNSLLNYTVLNIGFSPLIHPKLSIPYIGGLKFMGKPLEPEYTNDGIFGFQWLPHEF